MKGTPGLIRQTAPATVAGDNPEAFLFSTAFTDQEVDASSLVPWEARANEIGAKRMPAGRGGKLLEELWREDSYMARLGPGGVPRLEKFFDFAVLPANRDVICHNEYGDFMLVLLSGSIAVDREQPWGERLHLTEARPGEILGAMSLLDSGQHFSACTSLAGCEVAVLGAQALDEMMATEPALAASLIALLARKLPRRMRVVSAWLSDKKKLTRLGLVC